MVGGKRGLWLVGVGVVGVGAASWLVLKGGEDDDTADVRADDRADVLPTGEGYLIPGELPEGWEVVAAATPGTFAELAAAEEGQAPIVGEVVVYGDGDLDDPWEGPLLAAMRFEEGAAGSAMVTPASVPISQETVGGRSFTTYWEGDLAAANAPEDNLRVVGYGFSSEEVLATLGHLEEDPALAEDGLPEDYQEIARGPAGATGRSPGDLGGEWGGFTLAYGQGSIYELTPDITVTQHPAASGTAAGLIRLGVSEGWTEPYSLEVTRVRGQETHVVRDDREASNGVSSLTYQWFEPAVGQLVTVTTVGDDEAFVLSFIESLRVASGAEVEDVLARDHPALEPEPACANVPDVAVASGYSEPAGGPVPPPEELPVPEGADIVDLGQDGQTSWSLAFLHEGDGCGTLSLASSAPVGGPSELSVRGDFTEAQTKVGVRRRLDGSVGVFGLVADQVAEVRLDHSDGTSHDLQLYDLDSFESRAFFGFVPAETTAYELVALDEDAGVLDEWSVESDDTFG